MVVMMIYDRRQQEQEHLKYYTKDVVAKISEDYLEIICIANTNMAEQTMDNKGILDLAYMDVSKEEDIQLLRVLRRQHKEAQILLIADEGISPMKYLTPDIRASALLLRPFLPEQCQKVVREFVQAFYEEREDDGKEVLVIENRTGKIVVPYHQIYYIEVRERKLFFRLKDKEYSQYGSLDHVLQELPEGFLRCHRSFIFNAKHLDYVKLSENMVYLENGMIVPLSRSYKAEIKRFVNELRGV